MVGFVLAMFEGAMLIFSPFVSLLLPKFGRKNFILVASLCVISASIGFGLTVHIENDMVFFIISVALRILEGLAEACHNTSTLSLIAVEFYAEREMYYGWVESSIGVGLMMGPVIGQVLYNLFGYENTFYMTAGILTIPLVLQVFFIPKRINDIT